MNQLVQVLQERAGLDQQKAQQVAQVVSDFAQQHADELGQLAMQQMGGEGGVMGKLGGMFGNRS